MQKPLLRVLIFLFVLGACFNSFPENAEEEENYNEEFAQIAEVLMEYAKILEEKNVYQQELEQLKTEHQKKLEENPNKFYLYQEDLAKVKKFPDTNTSTEKILRLFDKTILGISIFFLMIRYRKSLLPITQNNAPNLKKLVDTLAAQVGINPPIIFINLGENQPNAFATGFIQKKAIIGIEASLIENFDADELEFVIAHELSHIKKRHMLKDLAIGTGIFGLAFFLSHKALRIILNKTNQLILKYNPDHKVVNSNQLTKNEAEIIGKLAGVFSSLLSPILFAYMRRAEYQADEGAALATSTDSAIKGLEKLKYLESVYLESLEETKRSAETEESKIKKFFKKIGDFLGYYFRTHPTCDERIQRLRELSEAELAEAAA